MKAEELSSEADNELARRAAAGSLESFEALVYRFESRVYRFVLQICRRPADAAEITQDTFVRAFSSLHQFDPKFSFASWIFSIARNKCIDFHRRSKHVSAEPVPDVADLDDPSQKLARKEDGERIWKWAWQVVPEAQFQALWLKYAEDMEVAEIAHALGKTKTHIKVLLFRGRKSLSLKLEKRAALDSADSSVGSLVAPPKPVTVPAIAHLL
jgi:RNA polymerase sigma-70 factor (ECF subfamily)